MTAVGVEPTTLALKVRCSTTELRGHRLGMQASLSARFSLTLIHPEYSRSVKYLSFRLRP